MVSLRTKEFAVAAPFAIVGAGLAAASTTVDGGHDAFMVRLGFWVLPFGALVWLVTWALHRIAHLETRLTRAEQRADESERLVKDLLQRVLKLEDSAKC